MTKPTLYKQLVQLQSNLRDSCLSDAGTLKEVDEAIDTLNRPLVLPSSSKTTEAPTRVSSLTFDCPVTLRPSPQSVRKYIAEGNNEEVAKYLETEFPELMLDTLQSADDIEMLTKSEIMNMKQAKNLVSLKLAELQAAFHFEEKMKDGVVRLLKLSSEAQRTKIQHELLTVLLRQNQILLSLWEEQAKVVNIFEDLRNHEKAVLIVGVEKYERELQYEEKRRKQAVQEIGLLKPYFKQLSAKEEQSLVIENEALKQDKERLKGKIALLSDEIDRLKKEDYKDEVGRLENELKKKTVIEERLNREICDLNASFDLLMKQNLRIQSYSNVPSSNTSNQSAANSTTPSDTESVGSHRLDLCYSDNSLKDNELILELKEQISCLQNEIITNESHVEELVGALKERDARIDDLKDQLKKVMFIDKPQESAESDKENDFVSRDTVAKLLNIQRATDLDLINVCKANLYNQKLIEEFKKDLKQAKTDKILLEDKINEYELDLEHLRAQNMELTKDAIKGFEQDKKEIENFYTEKLKFYEDSILKLNVELMSEKNKNMGI